MDEIGGHHVKLGKPGLGTQKMPVFSHMWKIDPKINIYTKTSMIIYKLRSRTCYNSGTTLRNWGKRERKKK
jgi:hypothetical protein